MERDVPSVFGEMAEKMRVVSWEILEVRMAKEGGEERGKEGDRVRCKGTRVPSRIGKSIKIWGSRNHRIMLAVIGLGVLPLENTLIGV